MSKRSVADRKGREKGEGFDVFVVWQKEKEDTANEEKYGL